MISDKVAVRIDVGTRPPGDIASDIVRALERRSPRRKTVAKARERRGWQKRYPEGRRNGSP